MVQFLNLGWGPHLVSSTPSWIVIGLHCCIRADDPLDMIFWNNGSSKNVAANHPSLTAVDNACRYWFLLIWHSNVSISPAKVLSLSISTSCTYWEWAEALNADRIVCLKKLTHQSSRRRGFVSHLCHQICNVSVDRIDVKRSGKRILIVGIWFDCKAFSREDVSSERSMTDTDKSWNQIY